MNIFLPLDLNAVPVNTNKNRRDIWYEMKQAQSHFLCKGTISQFGYSSSSSWAKVWRWWRTSPNILWANSQARIALRTSRRVDHDLANVTTQPGHWWLVDDDWKEPASVLMSQVIDLGVLLHHFSSNAGINMCIHTNTHTHASIYCKIILTCAHKIIYNPFFCETLLIHA